MWNVWSETIKIANRKRAVTTKGLRMSAEFNEQLERVRDALRGRGWRLWTMAGVGTNGSAGRMEVWTNGTDKIMLDLTVASVDVYRQIADAAWYQSASHTSNVGQFTEVIGAIFNHE